MGKGPWCILLPVDASRGRRVRDGHRALWPRCPSRGWERLLLVLVVLRAVDSGPADGSLVFGPSVLLRFPLPIRHPAFGALLAHAHHPLSVGFVGGQTLSTSNPGSSRRNCFSTSFM